MKFPPRPSENHPGIFSLASILLLAAGILSAFSLGRVPPVQDPPTQQSPILAGIEIEVSEGRGDRQAWRKMADEMIRLKLGEPFSPDKFQETLSVLRDSKIFESIEVPDPDWSKNRITLHFQLTPFQRVREIQIRGGFPVFDREIQRATGLYSGRNFPRENIPQLRRQAVDLLKNQGYIDPQVEIEALSHPGDERFVNVRINIDKGDYFSIDNFSITGNHSFSGFRLKLRTDTWKKSLLFGDITRFRKNDLDQDIRNLLAFYRSKGFADVEITQTVNENQRNSTVDIVLEIDEGPHYRFSFHGNQEFSGRWTLKDDIDLTGGNRNDVGLRKSVRNIQERYRREGYLDAEVKIEEKDGAEGGEKAAEEERPLRIVIEEGVRSIIETVRIEGHHSFSENEIRKQMLTSTPGLFQNGAYNPATLREDIKAIKLLYFRHGYLDTEVESRITWENSFPETRPDKKTGAEASSPRGTRHGTLILEIEEGPQTLVDNLSISGVSAISPGKLRKIIALREKEPFREYLITQDRNLITQAIAELGYPHVRVEESVRFNEDRTGADLTYQVSEGPHVTLEDVHFIGNFNTRETALQEEMEIEAGNNFSAAKVLRSQRNIQNMEALNSVQIRIPGLRESRERVSLLVEVEERRPHWIEVNLGRDTERKFFGTVRGGDRNLWGKNIQTRGLFELSEIGYRMEGSLVEPRFLSSRINSATSLFVEKREAFNQDFGTRSRGFSQVFTRRLTDRDLNFGLTLGIERREQFLRDDGKIPAGREYLYQPRTVLIAEPSVVYNTTDSYTRPRQGVYGSVFLDFSRGGKESMDNFLRYRLEGRYYHTPVERLTLALRGRYGYIYPFGENQTLFDDRLFYLGGTSTVRGYRENLFRSDPEGTAVGGRELFLANLEARYDLGMNFESVAFYDLGALRKMYDPTPDDDFKSSAGLGIRYITPIGAIGLLYGWKLATEPGEDSGNFHFSIGYIF